MRSSSSCNSWLFGVVWELPSLPWLLRVLPPFALSLLLSCPWLSLGSAFVHHHQRVTVKQLSWQGGTSPQSLASPAAKIQGKWGSASMQDGLCRASTKFLLPQSRHSNTGVTALEKALWAGVQPPQRRFLTGETIRVGVICPWLQGAAMSRVDPSPLPPRSAELDSRFQHLVLYMFDGLDSQHGKH